MSILAPRCTALALCLGALSAGCSNGPPVPTDSGPSCGTPFLGDKTKPTEVVLTARGPDGVSAPVKDGDTVAMIFPLQGGRVIFAGVRATNLDPCAVTLTGALRDPATTQLRLDGRTINLKPSATDSGWGESDDDDISTFANVPVCPNQWSMTNLYGSEYELMVTVTDGDRRTATAQAKVVPSCAEPSNRDECLCICKGGYVLGESCAPPDAGAVDGGGT